ncbi:MAG TPA: hypothetical protein VFL69_07170 [Marmoricola sp.]|nr:hypothetical protein [Marmoricola sp.]
MPRRVTLPSADDLFRPTGTRSDGPARPVAAVPDPADATAQEDVPDSGRASSGRVRHDEKMTVYVTAEELLGLEHARLDLRRDHGLAVDRGRLVREAIAIVLADLDLNGADSVLVQRLGR